MQANTPIQTKLQIQPLMVPTLSPLCPIQNSGVKARSEVRRSEAALGAISQTFLVNAGNLWSSYRLTQHSQLGPTNAQALPWFMADTAARDSAKCQSSGAALGSQAYKECRSLLEDKMSIEKDVSPDRSYASTRGR